MDRLRAASLDGFEVRQEAIELFRARLCAEGRVTFSTRATVAAVLGLVLGLVLVVVLLVAAVLLVALSVV